MSQDLERIVGEHEEWRGACLNLVASENITSPAVRELLASDLGHRYTLPMNTEFDGMYIENAYRGTRFTDLVQARTEELARQVFCSDHAYVNSLSGHVAVHTVLLSTCERGDTVMAPSVESGGYHGWVGPYLPRTLGLDFEALPFSEKDWDLDYGSCQDAIRKKGPRLVVMGLSYFPFPFDMAPIRDACREVGALLCYDASHVLGLVAGGCFQQPLEEGADVMLGSTHKTFFGPQGGLIVTDDAELDEAFRQNSTWMTVDNAHWNRIAALGRALEEMRDHGRDYARQVVENSKALATALDQRDVPLRFKHRGYTESHQVMVDAGAASEKYDRPFNELARGLEEENIIVDSVGRIGTSEVTRRGMKVTHMSKVASFLVSTLEGGRSVREEVKAFVEKFGLDFC